MKFWYELKPYFDIFGSLIIPPICKSCGIKLLDDENILCSHCKKELDYIEKPDYCYKCGIGGTFNSYRSLCPVCESKFNKNYKLIRTILNYNDSIRPVILDYKYEVGFDSADYIVKDIIQHYPKEFKKINFDYITCVSSHWYRLLHRGYNHTEYISKKLGYILNIPYKKFIKKNRYTRSQTKFNYFQRQTNINHSFELIEKKDFSNKNILIFEDVITTGSTINEYIDVLMETKANLYILTYADARKINTLLEINNGS